MSGITLARIRGSDGSVSNQLDRSTDPQLYSSNTLYIADYNNRRIQKWIIDTSNGAKVAGGTFSQGLSDMLRLMAIFM